MTLHAEGQATCLKVKHVRVRYDLGELLDGRLHFHEIFLDEPTLTATQDLEGRTNLDPFFQKSPERARQAPELIRTVTGGGIHFSKELPDGLKQIVRKQSENKSRTPWQWP